MNQQLDALVRKVVFGSSPEAPTSDLDKYLFLRRFCALLFVPLFISFALGLAFDAPTLLWIVLGVGAAAWLVTAVKLPFDLRRERRRPPDSAV
jgi:hypothetical protein